MNQATEKNTNREAKYSFANINLIGKCNANCYFCLGKDIDDILSKQNQMGMHFAEWKNLDKYLDLCASYGVEKVYLTGENTDPLIYKYLQELINYIQDKGFKVGIRNNGYLAPKKIDTINSCLEEIGYSVNAISEEANMQVMGRRDIPKWDEIIPKTNNPRTSIIVSRYNVHEFFDIVKYLSKFDNIRYVQARCIVSETRNDQMIPDQEAFMALLDEVDKKYTCVDTFHGARIYEIHGMRVSFWKNWDTNINSLNYFSDGTINEGYFIIGGYLEQNGLLATK